MNIPLTLMEKALTRRNADLEKAGPEFSSHEEAIVRCVVGDSVEDGVVSRQFALVDDSVEVDYAEDFAGLGRDTENHV